MAEDDTGCLRFGELPELNQKYPRLAAFDLDGTLITTKGSSPFPKDEFDYVFFPKALKLLAHLQDEGFLLVVFTNQNYRGKSLLPKLHLIEHVMDDAKEAGISLLVYVATLKNEYRKPETGMFDKLLADFGISRVSKKSFYCGDADGLPGSHSSSDRDFADNTGLMFLTVKEAYDMIPDEESSNEEEEPPESSLAGGEEEKFPQIVIMMGAPGAGKDTFIENHLLDYTAVNRDDFGGSVPRCKKRIRELLAEDPQTKIVINATNPSRKARAEWISLLSSLGITDVGVIFINPPKEVVKAQNANREKRVPTIAISVFYSHLEPPESDEGITSITTIE